LHAQSPARNSAEIQGVLRVQRLLYLRSGAAVGAGRQARGNKLEKARIVQETSGGTKISKH
jgi:hypothetical protein